MKMPSWVTPKYIAQLTREARCAVVEHADHADAYPNQHRGCLWCYDGRLSHWYDDAANRFWDCPELADVILDRVDALYTRAYRGANRMRNIF